MFSIKPFTGKHLGHLLTQKHVIKTHTMTMGCRGHLIYAQG